MALNFLRRGSMKEKNSISGSAMKSLNAGDYLRLLLRFFQLVMGITIISLYAGDIVKAVKVGAGRDSKWMYITITGGISSIWAIMCAMPLFKAWFFFYIDFLMFFLYLVAFGIFGKMYIKENPEGNKGIIRMKNAVWIILVNMFLWLFSTAYGIVIFLRSRKAGSAQHVV